MDVKGLLIGVRRFEFADKVSGELVKGVKVVLATESDDKNSNHIGYFINDISAPFDLFQSLANKSKDLIGKLVTVSCDVKLNGRYTKLSAVNISAGL